MSFLPNEKIDFQEQEENALIQLTSQEINEKYTTGEVRIVTEQARYPLDTIVSLVDSGKYELNPEFQRRYRWSGSQKSRLIESFIMNVPIPPIFLYEDKFAHYEVMDGLQRLTAIYEFYNDKLILEGLEQWPELNGYSYSELPETVKQGVDRRYLSSIILLQETAKDKHEAQRLKQLVFERINSGGEKINDQESRNAIYNGPLNQLCIRLARDPALCKAWSIPENPNYKDIMEGKAKDEELNILIENSLYKKMGDVELVLRFFAFRQRFLGGYWKGTLRHYFDNYLQRGNEYHDATLNNLEELFEKTIKLVYAVFDKDAFKLWRHNELGHGHWRNQPTTTVYDPLMFAFSQHLGDEKRIIQYKEQFQDEIKKLYMHNEKDFEGRQTDRSKLEQRVKLFKSLIKDILGS